MTEKKVRILFFVLGLAVGIILGASVVRVYSDKVNAETTVSKNFVSRLFSNIVGLVYKPKPNKIDTIIVNNSEKNISNNRTTDTSKTSSQLADGQLTSDVQRNDSISDASKSEKTEDNIVVLSDKLIGATRLQILNNKNLELSKKDSITTNSSANKIAKPASVYAIEFWTSPLNNRGYKTQKNKIILFGINKDEPLKLIRLNEKLYLKFQNQYSIIENRNEFHSFEKVFDQQIISQLNPF